MQKQTTQINGRNVSYWERNPGSKRVMIMVHGFRGNHKGLQVLADQLPEYRLIMPDLPGYGESEPMAAQHTLAHYADFLEELCVRLDLQAYDLLAHSFGASVAVVFAARPGKPPRRLVLVTPAILNRGIIARLSAVYYRFASGLPQMLQQLVLATPFFSYVTGQLLIKNVGRTRRRELLAAGREDLKEFNAKVVIQGFLSFYKTPILTFARQLSMPTLVIAGRLDQLVPVLAAKKLEVAIPDAKLEIVELSGHLAPLERPAEVATMARVFLA